MTAPHDPNVRAMVDDVERLASMVVAEERRMRDESYAFDDETGTVRVKVNGYLWLTGLTIVDGTLRLGAPIVEARINEALARAAATVPAIVDAHLGHAERHLGEAIEGWEGIDGITGTRGQSDQMRAVSRDADGDSNS